ncbi:MAG: hypothetical protein ACRYHQ_09785 [Janthinobacterium lividum]
MVSTQLLAGQQGSTVGSLSDGAYGINDLVGMFGSFDVLTGGDENFVVGGIASNSIVTLGNGANAVGLVGNNNIVTLGAIQATTVTGPSGTCAIAGLLGLGCTADLVLLSGTGNSLTVAGAVTAALMGNNNSMSFGDPGFASSANSTPATGLVHVALVGTGDHIVEAADAAPGGSDPRTTITGGSGSNYVDVVNSASIGLGGQQNTIIVGGGSTVGSHFDITAGSGQDYVTLLNGVDASGNLVASSDVVRLAGHNNQVSGGSNATITGGAGDATLALGSPTGSFTGVFNVSLGGANNSITLQNSIASALDAGSGSDTVSLLSSSGNVAFHGSGNMLFIGGSPSGPIVVNDRSTGLQINVASALSSPLIISGSDRSLMIDLAPGAGSFSSAAQITQHLHSDGAGGMLLSAGTGSASPTLIDFVGNTHVTAANFAFG